MMTAQHTFEWSWQDEEGEDKYTEITVEFSLVKGCSYGPPENCWPDEYDYDIIEVTGDELDEVEYVDFNGMILGEDWNDYFD